MSNKFKIKQEFWIAAFIAAFIAYALLASWWKQNPVLGWIILIVLLAVFAFLFYRFASVRGWLKTKSKSVVEKVVFEKVASEREPLPAEMRSEILQRALNRCENEGCKESVKPHIHHIDMNNSHNNLSNLIALCPNCHQKAHDGKYTETQLRNWVRRDYQRLKDRRAKR
jgi:hypothetical protein